MATRELTANCAVCGRRPRDGDAGDCPCETEALRKAIQTAQRGWLGGWLDKIEDWVTNAAVAYVTTTFDALKERRVQQYTAYVNRLPYFREYRQHHGRPPIPQHYLLQLRAQLTHADQELQRGVNEDWKSCVMKYPEVLEYYYNQVIVELPRGPLGVPFGGHGAPGGPTPTVISGFERRPRKSGRASAPPPAPGMGFALPPDDGVSRRPSQRQNRRNSGSYILSGQSRPTVPMPPINTASGFGPLF